MVTKDQMTGVYKRVENSESRESCFIKTMVFIII